ncbi:hypothetical protein KM043_017849 [Ampulex compressa]|nr:hypothetical protein KM043_017849 [Ampulex compressa]
MALSAYDRKRLARGAFQRISSNKATVKREERNGMLVVYRAAFFLRVNLRDVDLSGDFSAFFDVLSSLRQPGVSYSSRENSFAASILARKEKSEHSY